MSGRAARPPTATAVRWLIGVLTAAAALLIVLILTGEGLDETAGRALGTAVLVACGSLIALAGSNLWERRPELALVGWLTAGVAALAFLALLAGIWAEDLFDDDGWKPAVYLSILALAGGHVSLLLAGGVDDDERSRWVRLATIAAIALLVVLAFVEIASPGEDVGIRAFGILAVLYVLGTVVLGLLGRFDGRPAPAAPPARAGAGVSGIDHAVIAVSDVRRAHAFYCGVLGAQLVEQPGGRFAFRFGSQQLNVHAPGIAAAPLAGDPVRPGNSDLCLVWNGGAAAAATHLRQHDVEPVGGPVPRNGGRGPGRSVYCRDPDGSLIELISYE